MACDDTSWRYDMDDFDDVEFIRKSINDEIERFAQELLDNKYCSDKIDARYAAKRVLIHGDPIPGQNEVHYGDDGAETKPYGSDDDSSANNHKKKIPEFLIIISLKEPKGSKRQENEYKKATLNAQSFLKLYHEDFELGRQTIRVVKSFSEMLTEIKVFVRGQKVSELPIVIFLGHGRNDGTLVFRNEEKEYVPIRTVLKDIAGDFMKTRPKGVASSQIRVVFSQCHGYKVDDKNNPGKVIAGEGLEYVYVTKRSKPRAWCRYHTDNPDTTKVVKMFDSEDIYLELPGRHSAVGAAFERLKKYMNRENIRYKVPGLGDFKKWLQRGPPDDVPKKLQDQVQELRKGLKVFLHLSCTVEPTGIFYPFKRAPYDCSKYIISSKTELINTISRFLREDAKNTAMPVILVEGKGSKDAAGSLVLHIGGDRVPVVELHEKFRHVDQLRFVFYCQDNKLWFSNAKLPDVISARHVELEQYHIAIISDGPMNKVLRKRPVKTREISPLKQN